MIILSKDYGESMYIGRCVNKEKLWEYGDDRVSK